MKENYTPLLYVILYSYLVGIMMYLIATRLKIMFAVSLVVRFMYSPHESHWKLAKRIIWYVSGINLFSLWYKFAKYDTL